MTLIVEDGTGVSGAESYASVAVADAYFAARTHLAAYTTWDAASTAFKEGSLREASSFLDATYSAYYRGIRQGRVQGLLWPRTEAKDDAGYDLPVLPSELVSAACELAGRAIASPLAPDLERGGMIKREKVGPLEVEYMDSAPATTSYGSVNTMLGPILNGMQPGGDPAWRWL